MSLQVWIPHTTNDDLRQVGLKSFEVRNNSNFLEFNPALNNFYGGEWSIRFNWSSTSANILFFNHTIIFQTDNENNLKINFKDQQSEIYLFYTSLTNDDHSILLTKHFESGEEVFNIYINDEWRNSVIWSNPPSQYPFVETAQLHSSISDFRIYDHCLSKMEIAQLANSPNIQDPIYIDKKGNIFTSAQFYEI